MMSRTINSIIRPCIRELKSEPNVVASDKISRAIELMVSHNLSCIAVVRNRRVIGMILLSDAFREIGLRMHENK